MDYKEAYYEAIKIAKEAHEQLGKVIKIGKTLVTQRDEAMQQLRNANSQVKDLIVINEKATSYLENHRDFLRDRGLMTEYTSWLKAKEDNPT